MPRWLRFFIPFFLFAFILAFQNCTRIHFSLDGSSEQQKSETDSGNGGVYEGKPGTYYRFVPGSTCEGSAALFSSIELDANWATVLFNYPTKCDVKKGPVPTISLALASLNGAVVGYRDGIYEYSETPVGPQDPPANPVEAFCQSLSPQADQVEVLVRTKSQAATSDGLVLVKSPGMSLQNYSFSGLQRSVALPKIEYNNQEFDLAVSIDQTVPRQLNIFAADVQFVAKGINQKVSVDCRTGSVLDPSVIMPAPGSPSMAFGVNGKVTVTNPLLGGGATQMIELASQKMLISMNKGLNGDFNLLRLNADGSMDATFGTGGWARSAVGSESFLSSTLELSNGQLLLAGTSDGNAVLMKLNADGSLDTSFGVNGKVIQDLGGDADSFKKVEIQSDGKILAVGGWGNAMSGISMAVVRYDASGTLDASFAVGGIRKLSYPAGVGVQIASSGQIFVASGMNSKGQVPGFGLAALQANGSLDLSFGSTVPGISGFDFGFPEQMLEVMKTQADEKIVLAGRVNSDYGLFRLLPSGQPDPAFGGGKGVVTNAYLSDYLHDVIIQPDGKILAIGGHDSAGPQIMRLDDDGQKDFGFGGGSPVNPNGPGNAVASPTDVREPQSGYITSKGKLRYVVMMANGHIAILEMNL